MNLNELNDLLNKNVEKIRGLFDDYFTPFVSTAVSAIALADSSKMAAVSISRARVENLLRTANLVKFTIEKYMTAVVNAFSYVILLQQLKEIDRDVFTEELTYEILKPYLIQALEKYLSYINFSGGSGTTAYLFQSLQNNVDTSELAEMIIGVVSE